MRKLIAKDARLAPLLPRWEKQPAPLTVTASVGTAWQDVNLDVPLPSSPLDGYKLEIAPAPGTATPYWIDTIRMQPVWPE